MRRSNSVGSRFQLPTIILGVWIIGVMISLTVTFWVIPSVITSSIKAVSGKCGTAYPVEVIWKGDLFCGTPIVPEDK